MHWAMSPLSTTGITFTPVSAPALRRSNSASLCSRTLVLNILDVESGHVRSWVDSFVEAEHVKKRDIAREFPRDVQQASPGIEIHTLKERSG